MHLNIDIKNKIYYNFVVLIREHYGNRHLFYRFFCKINEAMLPASLLRCSKHIRWNTF